jgi:hypothetical protein
MIYVLAYVAMLLLRLSRAPGGYGLLLGVVFVFSAFRYEVGCDWTGYLNQYDVFGSLTFAEAVATREPLWTVLIGLQVKLGVPYPWLNVISSFMFFYGIHQLAKRQPDALGFLVLLFPVLILNMPMSGIRQGAAVGIMCLAYLAFMDRRLVRFVGLVLLAAGFHSSAIVFLLLAPMVTGGLSRGRIALALLLALPGGSGADDDGCGEHGHKPLCGHRCGRGGCGLSCGLACACGDLVPDGPAPEMAGHLSR